jgi:RNA polymerase sigma factor (sigma-70 family)
MITQEKENTFVSLIAENKPVVHAIVRRYCRDVSYREDLFHDIILRAWKSYDSFAGTGTFTTWLCCIAKNTAIDRLRRLKSGFLSLAYDNTLYQIVDEPYRELSLPAFDCLSQKEQETLNLYIDGLTAKEIGAKLNEPANRIAVRMLRIKERLAKSVKQNGVY